MEQYIAFLRGINVGGHRVKMDRLRSLFEDMGLEDVSTFIASGNVVFSSASEDADALKDLIERHLEQKLGYEVATFLRSPRQLAAIAAVDAEEGNGTPSSSSLYVIFLHGPASESLRSDLAGLESEIDDFRFSDAEVYWRTRGKVSDSPLFGGGLEKVFRRIPTTMRNMNTIRRIVAKIGSGEAT